MASTLVPGDNQDALDAWNRCAQACETSAQRCMGDDTMACLDCVTICQTAR
jgi:hypothetical protein